MYGAGASCDPSQLAPLVIHHNFNWAEGFGNLLKRFHRSLPAQAGMSGDFLTGSLAGSALWTVLFAFDRNRRKPGETESVGPRRRHIDNAPANKWTAIIDRNHHRSSIAAIGDSKLGSERV
jgi:hypothetical protein